jgi:serine/threonine-protein kinase
VKVCPRCSEGFGDDARFCPLDGAELVKSLDPHLGRTIAARYRLIKRLGIGGMSNVYLARHVLIERMSAIKILRQELSLNPAHRERFLREARAVNRINHPNIVEITDYGESDGVTYLVMEYVASETLMARLSRGPLAWPAAASVALQVAEALARAHQAGIIHRDLKPENVLIVTPQEPRVGPEDPQIKLTDFGIAKIVDAPALTYNQQLFGTPGYIAPEYIESGTITPAMDLYSLGVVLYEMMTAKLPYDGKGQADLLFFPLTKPPIPPGHRVQGIPPDLEALVLRMLARVPADRPRDAFLVCDALTDALRRASRVPSNPAPRRPSIPDVEEPTQIESVEELSHIPASDAYMHAREQSAKWHAALVDLNTQIARAHTAGGAAMQRAQRAMPFVDRASEIAARLDKTARIAADAQAKLDLLEASGREFKDSLGRAIDTLVHDRARERAHFDALRAANLADEEARALHVVEDLDFQIAALEKQLEAKNVAHERAIMESSGALEGALSALRLMQNELARLVNEAARTVAGAA